MRRRPAESRAIAFLEALVAERRRTGEVDLPTIAHLAGAARVSVVTMWKAVGKLKDRGLVTANPRQGTRVTTGHDSPRSASASRAGHTQRAWRSVAVQIEQGIRTGLYARGRMLPRRKALMRRYGVGYGTLRRALRLLVTTRAVEPHGTGFRIRSVVRSGAHARVVLVAAESAPGALLAELPIVEDRYRALEAACAKNNLELAIVPFDLTRQELRAEPGPDTRDDSTLGYLIWTVSMSPERTRDTINRFARKGKPVAVLVESAAGTSAHRLARHSRCKFFSAGGTGLSGTVVGRLLAALGHHSVVFVSPYHAREWPKTRLDCMRRVLESSGTPCNVYSVVDEAMETDKDMVSKFGGLSETIEVMRVAAAEHAGPDSTAAQLAHTALENSLNALIMDYTPLADLCDQALACKDATAWVAANDRIALGCLRYLRDHGRRVPEDISVIGFDDSPEALTHGLTSYNFDAISVANAMLSHVIDPAAVDPANSLHNPIELEGYISQRRSTNQIYQAFSH